MAVDHAHAVVHVAALAWRRGLPAATAVFEFLQWFRNAERGGRRSHSGRDRQRERGSQDLEHSYLHTTIAISIFLGNSSKL
jgi:hypothetical protein